MKSFTYKVILFCFKLLVILSAVNAQDVELSIKDFPDEESRKGSFSILPEAGFWFGTVTNAEVAPQLGYYVSDRWLLGIGGHYIYYKTNPYYYADEFTTHIFGFRGFTRYSIIRDARELLPIYLFDELFLHLEYEELNLDSRYFGTSTSTDYTRFWSSYTLIGAGFTQQMGPRFSSYFVFLWNLNFSYNSIYNNPSYRIGISILLN
mgnify:CR=1 FL=1